MITDSRISYGDQLGAQMTTVANLIFLSEINKQEICFYKELENFRRGYQFLDVFNYPGIKVIESNNRFIRLISKRITRINSSSWKNNMRKVYFDKINSLKDKLIYKIMIFSHYDFKLLEKKGGGSL